MSDKEKLQQSREAFDEKALAEHGREHRERLREDRERAAEKGHERDADSARREVEKATRLEKEPTRHEVNKEAASVERRRGPASKRERDASYNRTMKEVRSQMSAPSRAFSTFIHNPVVEKVSDAVGGSIARPNAILSGAGFAFLFTLGIYLVARYYGYGLSGTETIASFIAGWVLGLVFDYFRLLVLGKK